MDYFITKNWEEFTNESFADFKKRIYEILLYHIKLIKKSEMDMTIQMVQSDWLSQYDNWEGIAAVFRRLDIRANFPSNFEENTKWLIEREDDLNNGFKSFFKEIQITCSHFILQNSIV